MATTDAKTWGELRVWVSDTSRTEGELRDICGGIGLSRDGELVYVKRRLENFLKLKRVDAEIKWRSEEEQEDQAPSAARAPISIRRRPPESEEPEPFQQPETVTMTGSDFRDMFAQAYAWIKAEEAKTQQEPAATDAAKSAPAAKPKVKAKRPAPEEEPAKEEEVKEEKPVVTILEKRMGPIPWYAWLGFALVAFVAVLLTISAAGNMPATLLQVLLLIVGGALIWGYAMRLRKSTVTYVEVKAEPKEEAPAEGAEEGSEDESQEEDQGEGESEEVVEEEPAPKPAAKKRSTAVAAVKKTKKE